MYRQPSHAGLASLVAAQGRGGDSMLVHMTPDEVNDLKNIAEAHGLPFMINPRTGLPEATLLGDVFKAIWGGVKTVGSAIVNNPQLTAAVVGTTYGAMKGDLSKGLEAGIKAYAGSSLLGGLASAGREAQAAKAIAGKRTPWADYEDMYTPSARETSEPIQPIKPTVQQPPMPNVFNQIGAGISSVLNPKATQQPQQSGIAAQGQQMNPVTRLLLNYGINRLEQKYGGAREGTAPSQPVQYRDVRYSRGRVNPRFREPGQPYWIEGGYEDRGYTTEYPGYTQGPTVQQPNLPQSPIQPPNQPYGMAMGGMVPSDEGVIPAPNYSYPMANIKSAGYSVASQRPRSAELLGGYDTAVDPFTGEETKSQSNFADGGAVSEENKLKDYFANLRPNAPALANTFNNVNLNAGLGGLQPVAPELADYYKSLLVPPGPRPDRIDLTDYFKTSGFKSSPNLGRVCPSGQHLNTTTMQCEDDTVGPPSPPPPPPVECPTGQVRGPSGQCEPIIQSCPGNQVRNPKTGNCEDATKGCDPGTHLEIVDGIMVCVPDEPTPPPPPTPPVGECRNGYHKDSKGNCVPDITIEECEPGSTMNAEGKCVPDTPPPPQPPICPSGQHLDFATMKCEPDAPPPPPPPPPQTCGEGKHIDPKTGECVKNTKIDLTCPDGSQQFDEEGQLICPDKPEPPSPPPICPPGQHLDTDRMQCVPDSPTSRTEDCASMTPNSAYNAATDSCECKEGYTRTESGKCVEHQVDVDDTGLWEKVLTGLGWVGRNLSPLEIQLAFKIYDELKKGKVITSEKTCRGGADKIFNTDTREFVCPEDMPSTGDGGSEYEYRGDRGYSSGCPDPSMQISLADGGEVAAGDLKVGDMVRTMHETTLKWGDYKVTHKEIVNQPKLEIVFNDGEKKVVVSESHRFWVNDSDWVYATNLSKGDDVSGWSVSSISALGEGPVVKITVDDAHTYIMEGLFSHNIKSFNPPTSGGPTGRVIIDEPILENAAGGRIKSRRKYATGGIANLNSGAVNPAEGYNFGFARGGMAAMPEYKAGGKLLRGPGDGMSDDIPAVIRGKTVQRAALADGEFVVPADVVSHLGNGSTDAGAKKLYKMMEQIRRARTGKAKQAPRVNTDRFLPRV